MMQTRRMQVLRRNHAVLARRSNHPGRAERSHPEETAVFRLVDDDFSIIGRWFLADCTKIDPSDIRIDAHHFWSLALWDLAKSDATLYAPQETCHRVDTRHGAVPGVQAGCLPEPLRHDQVERVECIGHDRPVRHAAFIR
jgi:hypothetical protein